MPIPFLLNVSLTSYSPLLVKVTLGPAHDPKPNRSRNWDWELTIANPTEKIYAEKITQLSNHSVILQLGKLTGFTCVRINNKA